MRRTAWLLVFLLAPVPVQAQTVQEAVQAYDRGELQASLGMLTSLRDQPLESPSEVATVYLYLGVIRAAMGDRVSARRAFDIVLALDPDRPTPSELGPDLRRLFESARAQATALDLRLEAGPVVVGEVLPLHIDVTGAPSDFVAAVRVRAAPSQGDGWVERLEGDQSRAVNVPASTWRGGSVLSIVLEALTEHGAVVARVRRTVRGSLPAVSASAARTGGARLASDERDPVDETSDDGSVADEAWFWLLIASIVGIGIGVSVAVVVAEDQRGFSFGVPVVE